VGGGRWKPTEGQRRLLSATFSQNPYPDVTTKNLLAEQLGVNRPRVSKWFQHRRESATRAGCFQGVEQRARRTPNELLVLNGMFGLRPGEGLWMSSCEAVGVDECCGRGRAVADRPLAVSSA